MSMFNSMLSSSTGSTPIGSYPNTYHYLYPPSSTQPLSNSQSSSPYYYAMREFQQSSSSQIQSSSQSMANTATQGAINSNSSLVGTVGGGGIGINGTTSTGSHTQLQTGGGVNSDSAGFDLRESDSKERKHFAHSTNSKYSDKFNKSTPHFFSSASGNNNGGTSNSSSMQQQFHNNGSESQYSSAVSISSTREKDKEKLSQIQKIYTSNNTIRSRNNFHKSQSNFYNMQTTAFFNQSNVSAAAISTTGGIPSTSSIERSATKKNIPHNKTSSTRLSQSPPPQQNQSYAATAQSAVPIQIPEGNGPIFVKVASSQSLSGQSTSTTAFQPSQLQTAQRNSQNKLKHSTTSNAMNSTGTAPSTSSSMLFSAAINKESKSSRNSIGKNQHFDMNSNLINKFESLNQIYKPVKSQTYIHPGPVGNNNSSTNNNSSSHYSAQQFLESTRIPDRFLMRANDSSSGAASANSHSRFYQTEPNFNKQPQKKSIPSINPVVGGATVASTSGTSSKVLPKTKLIPIQQPSNLNEKSQISSNTNRKSSQIATPSKNNSQISQPQSLISLNPFKNQSSLIRLSQSQQQNKQQPRLSLPNNSAISLIEQKQNKLKYMSSLEYPTGNSASSSMRNSNNSNNGGGGGGGIPQEDVGEQEYENENEKIVQNYEESFDTLLNQSSKLQTSEQDIYNYDIDFEENIHSNYANNNNNNFNSSSNNSSSVPSTNSKTKQFQPSAKQLNKNKSSNHSAGEDNSNSQQMEQQLEQPVFVAPTQQRQYHENRKSLNADLEVILEQHREEEPKEVPLDLLAQVQKISEARPKTSQGGRRRRYRQKQDQPDENEIESTNPYMISPQGDINQQQSEEIKPREMQPPSITGTTVKNSKKKLDFSPLKNQQDAKEDAQANNQNSRTSSKNSVYAILGSSRGKYDLQQNQYQQQSTSSSQYLAESEQTITMPSRRAMFHTQADRFPFQQSEKLESPQSSTLLADTDSMKLQGPYASLGLTKKSHSFRGTFKSSQHEQLPIQQLQETSSKRQSNKFQGTQAAQNDLDDDQNEDAQNRTSLREPPRMMNLFQKGHHHSLSKSKEKIQQPDEIPLEVHVQEDEHEYIYEENERNERKLISSSNRTNNNKSMLQSQQKHSIESQQDSFSTHKIIIRHNKSAAGNKVRKNYPATQTSDSNQQNNDVNEQYPREGTKKQQHLKHQHQDDVVERGVVSFKTGLDSDFINLFASIPQQF